MFLSLIKYFYIRIWILQLRLVYLPTCLIYSLLLIFIACFMVDRKLRNFTSLMSAHNGSTISTISDIKLVAVEKCNHCTGPWMIHFTISGKLDKIFFAFLKTVFQSLGHVIRETWLKKIYLFSFETNMWRLSRKKSAQSTPPCPSNTPKYAAFFHSVQC